MKEGWRRKGGKGENEGDEVIMGFAGPGRRAHGSLLMSQRKLTSLLWSEGALTNRLAGKSMELHHQKHQKTTGMTCLFSRTDSYGLIMYSYAIMSQPMKTPTPLLTLYCD